MNLKKFDKLQKRDFKNGAVLDEIRKTFKVIETLQQEKIVFPSTKKEIGWNEAIDYVCHLLNGD